MTSNQGHCAVSERFNVEWGNIEQALTVFEPGQRPGKKRSTEPLAAD